MNTQDTALVLIDLQKESNFGLQQFDHVIKHTKQTIDACRDADIPVIYTRQINRHDKIGLSKGEPLTSEGTPFYYSTEKDNHEIIDDVAPEENDLIIDKYRWSAFYESNLDLTLRSLGVKNIIVGGVVTDGCVMTTVFDAYFRDYKVHFVKDMCTTSNEGAHMASIMIMSNWIYNMEIYNTPNLIKRLKGESYKHWSFEHVDNQKFTPENMRNVFQTLSPEEE